MSFGHFPEGSIGPGYRLERLHLVQLWVQVYLHYNLGPRVLLEDILA